MQSSKRKSSKQDSELTKLTISMLSSLAYLMVVCWILPIAPMMIVWLMNWPFAVFPIIWFGGLPFFCLMLYCCFIKEKKQE